MPTTKTIGQNATIVTHTLTSSSSIILPFLPHTTADATNPTIGPTSHAANNHIDSLIACLPLVPIYRGLSHPQNQHIILVQTTNTTAKLLNNRQPTIK